MKAVFLIGFVLSVSATLKNGRKKIMVTGGSGLVGSALKRVAQETGDDEWVFLSSKDGDLVSYEETAALFSQHRPTHVVHLAANVGGLFKNMRQQAKMYDDNLLIGRNVIHAAHVSGVKKMISCLSTCIFPDKTSYPIDETMLHSGEPHRSNYGYAHAKRSLEIQSRIYSEQYGHEYSCIVPTNIFGPHDNYNLEDGHVIPVLTHKCYNAKKNQAPFEVLGSGTPLRQFISSYDVAKIISRILNSEKKIDTVILAPTEERTIGEVAFQIAAHMGYTSQTVFDTTKADGQYRKTASNRKLLEVFPETTFTPFEQALGESVDWFSANYEKARK
ncbi:MAG: GDP-L-fucose synthase [Amphiamblys sp. WSBS2006]|nr:MAG: GDP-L-fucose synthase [Amphiamblys sp. WSBS2006]